MPGESKSYRAVALVVIGVIVLVLGAFLLIGVLEGDDTENIDPQNGEVVTTFLGGFLRG